MAMAQSLFTGMTGLLNHQLRLDVVGNNLSNINTTAFKRHRHEFRDLMTHHLKNATAASNNRGATNPLGAGLGTSTGAIHRDFNQSNLEQTGNPLDVGIRGNGHFVLHRGAGANETEYYTRDGSFYLYAERLGDPGAATTNPKQLLANDGYAVQGWMAQNGQVNTAGDVEDIFIPLGQAMDANATTAVTLEGNVFSGVDVIEPNAVATGTSMDPAVNATTWVSAIGGTVNVGHVETTAALYDSTAGAAATAATDLVDLQFVGSNGNLTTAFAGLLAGEQIGISFERGGEEYSGNFVYGTAGQTYTIGGVNYVGNGTTLNEWMRWLDGDTAAGGTLGTLTTAAVLNAPAENAGCYLRTYAPTDAMAVDYDNAQPPVNDITTRFSIASNLGADNAITDLTVSYKGPIDGKFFDRDPVYGTISEGGSESDRITIQDQVDTEIVDKELMVRFSLVNRYDTVTGVPDQPNAQHSGGVSVWRYIVEGPDQNGDTAGAPDRIFAAGVVQFDGDGVYSTAQQDYTGHGITFDFAQNDFAQMGTETEFGLSANDGYLEGTLENFDITKEGMINGRYSNGLDEIIGQLALAIFPNDPGLESAGQNLFIQGAASGAPTYGTSADAGFGETIQRSLETSNVDFSIEMTDLITAQRGFQVSSRVITTSDEMLQNLLSLGR